MVRKRVALSHWPYSLSAGVTLSSARACALAGGAVVVRAGSSAPPLCACPRLNPVRIVPFFEGRVPFCPPRGSPAPPASGAMERGGPRPSRLGGFLCGGAEGGGFAMGGFRRAAGAMSNRPSYLQALGEAGGGGVLE